LQDRFVFHAAAMLLSSSSSTCLQLARVLPCALQLLRHSSAVAENVKQWQAKATKELKGKDPLQTLAYETADVSSSRATCSYDAEPSYNNLQLCCNPAGHSS
jgi:hypothetical protein